ncbi:MAG: C39 family peptidase [Burkholderiales bacterium]|nr:C39 family peptidase [Pseudomonadota bacterium]
MRLAHAGSVDPTDAVNRFSVKVTSLKEARYQSTIRQQYDYSCGSAALATLLTHHYGDPVTERMVFDSMYDNGIKAKIRREGFSLLDIQHYLEARGYRADGFEVSLDKLIEVGIPAIVLIRDRKYNYFVVIKGIRGNRVLVGDPSRGSRVIARADFETLWQKRIAFLIHNKRENAAFNTAADWHARQVAPLRDALSRESLANITLLRAGRNDF